MVVVCVSLGVHYTDCVCVLYFIVHFCVFKHDLVSQDHLVYECMEVLKCRKEWKAHNTEKVNLALHISVNSQKLFVKRPII